MSDRVDEGAALGPSERLEAPDEKKFYHDPGGDKARTRARRISDLLAAAGGPKGSVDWRYWEMVYDFEEAPMTTDVEQLRAAGFELPASSSLNDAQLDARLEALLEELGRMHVEVYDYDHVSARELYELLTEQVLHEERRDIPVRPGEGWMIDVSCIRPPREAGDDESVGI